MISCHPVLKRLGIIGIPFFVLLLAPPGVLFSLDNSGAAVVTSVGVGAPPPEKGSPDASAEHPRALDDAERNAVLLYLKKTLGAGEFVRLRDAVDTLILPEYQKYITKAEIKTVSTLPGGDIAVLSADVTIDTAALAGYLENIKKLQAQPEAPRTLSAPEKENLISKAQAIYIQGEVASDILLDRLRGIESFLSARTLFETAESADGVYRCLMGTGRARASLGDVAAARDDFDRALSLAADLKRPDYAAETRIARAQLMAACGDTVGAAREIGAVLDDASLTEHEEIVGEALLVDAELDYGNRMYEPAGTKAAKAVTIFEGLADAKRLTQAQLLRGLILIAEGDGPGAVESFKLAKNLSDRLDDNISAGKALIGMSRAYRLAGDPKTASLYLTDALKTVRGAGWVPGEIACLCETAYTQIDGGDPAGAEASAGAAYKLSATRDDPALTAASLFALGEASRALGKKEAAYEALVSCVTVSSDIRVLGDDVPFLFFGDDRRDTALAHLLDLSIELGRQKKVTAVVAGYEGSLIAREVLRNPPVLPARETELVRLFRDAAMRAIATDDASLGGDFVRFADTSRAETTALRAEAIRSISDAKERIARESSGLAAFMGIENPDPADLARSLPAGTALVHWVVGGGDAFALVAADGAVSIVKLPGGYDEIPGLLARLFDAAGAIPAAAGTDTELPLAFTEASTSLTTLLLPPILPGLVGVTAIGISPGTGLPPVPIQALGRYDDEGRFTFLGERYTLFTTSWLNTRVAAFDPSRAEPAGRDVLVVGDMDLPGAGEIEPPPPTEAVDAPAGSGGPVAVDEGALRIVRGSPDSAWWEAQAGLIAIPEKDVWAPSDFSRTEYLSLVSRTPVLTIPGKAGRGEVSAFVKAMVAASGGGPVLRGYGDAVKTSAVGSRAGKSVGWTFLILTSDFVSEQR